MVRMIKESFAEEDFLRVLHILMFMDDTALVSTSKDGIIEKFKKCQEFCEDYGITINQIKTKFMVINKIRGVEISIESKNIIVKYCSSYIHPRAQISDGCYNTVINFVVYC